MKPKTMIKMIAPAIIDCKMCKAPIQTVDGKGYCKCGAETKVVKVLGAFFQEWKMSGINKQTK